MTALGAQALLFLSEGAKNWVFATAIGRISETELSHQQGWERVLTRPSAQSGGEGEPGAWIVYDGDCPFCSRYVQMVRLREAVGPVRLVNAREGGPLVEEARRAGFDLDAGMVLKMGGKALLRRRLCATAGAVEHPSRVVQPDQPGHPELAHRGADPVPDLAVGPQPDAASARPPKDPRCALNARRRPSRPVRGADGTPDDALSVSPSRRANVSIGPRTLVSGVIVLVLGLQVISIITWSGRYTWPFTDYPMYARSRQEGDRVVGRHFLYAVLEDGREVEITPDDLGGNVFRLPEMDRCSSSRTARTSGQ